SLFNTIAVL
nr:Chain C, GAG PEPTIDE [synthetic construct]2C7U_C Chain C, Gag Protein [Human immunodeficiency virus 1]2C7U_F Chain F, Gag Protein [Human immunodeficiency virus 1]5NMG_C Chain C, Gag protein [Human immunodeficiency virus 1]5NMG_H Chain H, Gag protein [Human immunodeficiency virus 1]5NMK_C Chain C, Gag protein [Human immunodeficiency virus 1]